MELSKLFYTKKGQLAGSAVGNIITLIVGVGVSVLVLIFVGSLGGQTFELVEDKIDDIGLTVFAENVTALNGTAVTLTYTVDSGFTAINSTVGNVVDPSNYTALGTSFTLDQGTVWESAQVNLTYTYQNDTVAGKIKGGIVSSFKALEQTGDYLPIIVLAVVISLVLMLVLGFANVGSGNGGNNAL